ncbi:MAG: MotA/TolQ/ExbB proton channel family protein [Deltaproteobacteria bacterium]|nr:MotA/TolQ/ExbB proton channel family protein [Deltaproteobacteria bacterium]
MFDFLTQGGTMMWILLGWSIVGIAFIVERFIALWFRYRINSDEFTKRVLFFVSSHNYARAIEVCNTKPSNPLSKVIKAGLLKANKSDKEIQRSMEEEMLRSIPDIQRNVDWIAVAANTATLLGLLGTIFGLILAFQSLKGLSAQARQTALGDGISVAMYTTAFGLIIAIPFLIAHYWLNRRANRMIEVIEESSVQLLNHVASRRGKPTKAQ